MATSIKRWFSITVLAALLVSCNTETVKEKAQSSINNTGKSIGRGTREFIKGVKEGVDKTIQCKVELDPALKDRGINPGKFYISQTKGASDNMLVIYLVFEQDFNRKISIKLFDKNGQEYGRTSAMVADKAGEAHNVDFAFDSRTEIEAKSKFVLY